MHYETLTVCFADLSHFSKYGLAVGDEKMVSFLQDTFTHIGEIIVANSGRIHKYIGDSILFTFTDPIKAINSAREIAKYEHIEAGITLNYHVAMATGTVIVTRLGHPSYQIEDILGQVVNNAAMLMKKAYDSPTRIAMCKETEKYLNPL